MKECVIQTKTYLLHLVYYYIEDRREVRCYANDVVCYWFSSNSMTAVSGNEGRRRWWFWGCFIWRQSGQLQFLTNKNLINTFTYLYFTPSRYALSRMTYGRDTTTFTSPHETYGIHYCPHSSSWWIVIIYHGASNLDSYAHSTCVNQY